MKKGRTIIPIVEYESGMIDYPLPIWSGAFFDAQVESLIGQYNANQFENGVTLSSILMFDFGDTTDANGDAEKGLARQKQKLESQLKGTSQGTKRKEFNRTERVAMSKHLSISLTQCKKRVALLSCRS
jgi:hypothetical protein